MKDENGIVVNEKEVMKHILDELANLLCFAYEMESPEGKAFTAMLNSASYYGHAIYFGTDPRDTDCAQEIHDKFHKERMEQTQKEAEALQ